MSDWSTPQHPPRSLPNLPRWWGALRSRDRALVALIGVLLAAALIAGIVSSQRESSACGAWKSRFEEATDRAQAAPLRSAEQIRGLADANDAIRSMKDLGCQ